MGGLTRGARVGGRGSTTQESISAKGYAKLHAWQLADDLALEVFKAGRQLPADLRWLALQLMRAATSVPANIAEGYHRGSLREYIQSLSVARGSLAEVEYYLHFLLRADLISQERYDQLAARTFRTGQTLAGLINALRSKLPSKSRKWDSAVREEPLKYIIDAIVDSQTPDPRPSTLDQED